jgi:anaerobic selenocysteine-containing dehydrogenase
MASPSKPNQTQAQSQSSYHEFKANCHRIWRYGYQFTLHLPRIDTLGTQGGSVVRFLAEDGTFQVRAVTRDPNGMIFWEIHANGRCQGKTIEGKVS